MTAATSLPAGLQTGQPLTLMVNGACVCMCFVAVCAFLYTSSAEVEAAGEDQIWCWFVGKQHDWKSCFFFKQKALRCLFGWTQLFLASIQEVELMTLSSQARGLCLWGVARPDIVQAKEMYQSLVQYILQVSCTSYTHNSNTAVLHRWVNLWLRTLLHRWKVKAVE